AEEANAAKLAPESLGDARRFLEEAERQLQQQAYGPARMNAVRAKNRASQALRSSVSATDNDKPGPGKRRRGRRARSAASAAGECGASTFERRARNAPRRWVLPAGYETCPTAASRRWPPEPSTPSRSSPPGSGRDRRPRASTACWSRSGAIRCRTGFR